MKGSVRFHPSLFISALLLLPPLTMANNNAPVITVNGQIATGDAISALDPATITMTTAFSGGRIFYTTDGTPPQAASTRYNAPLTFGTNVTLRAIAFSSDFTQSAERGPLQINIVPGYTFSARSRGEGSVTQNPRGNSFPAGTLIELTASPAENWEFVQWSGDADGANPTIQVVTLDRNMEIEALFGTNRVVETFGAGTVRKTPSGPEPPCVYIPEWGCEAVVLQAIPEPGHYFVRWGERDVTVSPTTLMPYSNPSQMEQVWGLFLPLEEKQHSLTVLVDGPGMVTISPARNVFTNGESVTLTAIPGRPNTELPPILPTAFLGWTGDENGNEMSISLTMDSSKTITATFENKVEWLYRSFYAGGAVSVDGHGRIHHGNVYTPSGEVIRQTGPLPVLPLDEFGNVYLNWPASMLSLSAEGAVRWDEPTGEMFGDSWKLLPITLASGRVWGQAGADTSIAQDVWVFTYDGQYVTNMLISIGAGVADSEGNVYFPNLQSFTRDGELRWEVPDGGAPFAVVEDVIYAIHENEIRTYRPDSTFVRAYEFSSSITGSPIVGPDGTIYAGTEQGLEALK